MTNTKARSTRGLAALAAGLLASAPVGPWAPVAAAADGSADVARLQAELIQLRKEVREQRQVIFQLMQVEQQHYDMLLKYLQAAGMASGEMSGAPAAPAPAPAPAAGRGDHPEAPTAAPVAASSSSSGRETGVLSGKVRGASGEAYVYVDGMRSNAARGRTVEIKQKDRQFVPRSLVVPLGTKLVFPNADAIIHNVFSTSPGNGFDLGSIKGGETSSAISLMKPGQVEIFCNIHSKMRADVLVVPNGYWTRVGSDGSFQISGIPAGNRKVVLWGPGIKATSHQVDISSKGAATVTFNAEAASGRPHLNKRGQAYGSYDD